MLDDLGLLFNFSVFLGKVETTFALFPLIPPRPPALISGAWEAYNFSVTSSWKWGLQR